MSKPQTPSDDELDYVYSYCPACATHIRVTTKSYFNLKQQGYSPIMVCGPACRGKYLYCTQCGSDEHTPNLCVKDLIVPHHLSE